MDLAQKPVYKLDLAAGTSVVNLTTPLVEGDDRAQTFTLELTDKGAPANLDGYSVTAYFGRGKTAEAEADTIPLSGTVSGNVATITLTESCYSRSCYFSMPIRLSNGATGQKRTYLIVRGTVVKSVDGTIIDPDGSVPSLDDLFAQIAVMERSRQAAEEATEEALAAKDKANAAATSAVNIATEKGDQAIQLAQEEADKQNVKIATLTEEIDRNTAPPIIPTATGSIVSITDGAARPSVELISHIEPVETGSGEKGPNNPWTISGWDSVTVYAAGKNLLDAAHFVSRQGQPNDAAVGTDRIIFTSPAINETGRFSGIIVPMVVGETVTFSMKEIVSNGNTIADLYYEFLDAPPEYAYNGGTNFTTARYFTATATKPWLIINLWWVADATNGIAIVEPQLEVGNAATAFEAIKEANSLTETLPETVYGGDMYWLTGVLENYGHKLVIDGTNIAVAKHESVDGVYVIYNIGAYGHPLPAGGGMIACSHFPAGEVGANSFHVTPNNNGTLYLGSIPGINDAAAYNAWLANNPITCVYRVAEPERSQLTPQQLDTLKGANNVWSDCGDTTLSYVADTKLYIDQKLAAIAAATL